MREREREKAGRAFVLLWETHARKRVCVVLSHCRDAALSAVEVCAETYCAQGGQRCASGDADWHE